MKITVTISSMIERAFLAALHVITGSIVLLLRKETTLPYIYAYTHALLFVGSMGMVLLICRKLVPKYFTPGKVFSVRTAVIFICKHDQYAGLWTHYSLLSEYFDIFIHYTGKP